MLQCCYESVKEDTNEHSPIKCLMLDYLSDANFPPFVSSHTPLPETFSVENKKYIQTAFIYHCYHNLRMPSKSKKSKDVEWMYSTC